MLNSLSSLPLSYFNSHAHVERDSTAPDILTDSWISTHTLTWSVTNSFQWDYIPMIISTHMLTWSVTKTLGAKRYAYEHFNSHAHVERDLLIKNNGKNISISTHTLTWSVTLWLYINISFFTISTHTLTWSVTRL